MAKDEDYRKLIRSREWQRLRATVLRQHPRCVRCEQQGIVRLATEVHHIAPIEGALSYSGKCARCFNPSNLMPLCHTCHVAEHMRGKELNKQRNKEQAAAAIKTLFR